MKGAVMNTCKVEGCNRKHYTKGYCERHYLQMYNYGKILERTRFDPNKIVIKSNIAEIILYNQKNQEVARAVIDVEDVEKVKKHKWCLSKGYAVTSIHKKLVGLPCVIMGIEPGGKRLIDHRDRKPLNNRKPNLRICTRKENNRNKGKPKTNTSGFKGVDFIGKKWRAAIKVNQKRIHIGMFKHKTEAALAYNRAAIQYFGEFACLNKT